MSAESTVVRRTRATNIQVPGAAPKQPEQVEQVEQQDVAVLGTAQAAAMNPGDAFAAFAATQFPEATAPVIDIEALRAQIREEERSNIHAELGVQIRAAAAVVNGVNPTIAGARSDYRKMRAADIDHTRLTAPVLSLDGWVCPPAPEAKK